MATVFIQKHQKKKGISYNVQFRDPITGKKRHFKTFHKKREAHQAANDLRTMLDAGKIPAPRQTKISPLTFNEVGESLIEEWDKRLQRNDLKPKTHYEYRSRLRVLDRMFGKKILCTITHKALDNYLTDVADHYTNVTANRSLSVIKKVFKHGVKLKAVIDDVTESMPFLSEKEHVRNRFLLPTQLDKLIDATQSNRGKFYMPSIIYLGAEHGASKQEVLSLEWSDIDFEFQEAGLIRFFRTKNTKERTEFLMPRTKKALLAWKSHLEWKRHRIKETEVKSDNVFCRIDGTPLKSFNKAWWACLKAAGIKDFHFHDLRHTFCSNLIMSGGDLKDAKEMIGHADISMTDRYSHLTNDHKFSKQRHLATYYDSAPQI